MDLIKSRKQGTQVNLNETGNMVERIQLRRADPCGKGMPDNLPLIAASICLCVRQTALALPVLPEVSIRTATPSVEDIAPFAWLFV